MNEEEGKRQASVFGNLGVKVTDSRTIDYCKGGLDQKPFQDLYCGCLYHSGNTFLCIHIARNWRSLLICSFHIHFRFVLFMYNCDNHTSNSFSRKEYPPQLQKVEADHIRLPRSQGVGKLSLEFSFLLSRIFFLIPDLGGCVAKSYITFGISTFSLRLCYSSFVQVCAWRDDFALDRFLQLIQLCDNFKLCFSSFKSNRNREDLGS